MLFLCLRIILHVVWVRFFAIEVIDRILIERTVWNKEKKHFRKAFWSFFVISYPTNSFKLDVRQMSFQVATVNVSWQPIICDQKQVIRINFSGLMNQHRVSHVWQGSSNRVWLVLIVDCTWVCTWCWDFSAQCTSVTFCYRVNWNFIR